MGATKRPAGNGAQPLESASAVVGHLQGGRELVATSSMFAFKFRF